jgi:sugar phosphate isomerase/epimerase
MKSDVRRRQFLQTTTAGALAGAVLGKAAWAGAASPGIPDAVRSERQDAQEGPGAQSRPARPARMFAGCCAYSYGKYLNLKHPTMTMEDFIRKAPELRVVAVDMTVYYLKSTDPAYLASLRHLAYRHGVAFSGAACGVSMVQADAAARQKALSDIRNWIDVADRLGAPHLRVFGGKLPSGHTVPEAVGWIVETMKPACDYAGEKGIMVGIEDHSGITQSAGVCLDIIHRVNSPWAGINLDVTHFVPAPGLDQYAQIEQCIPYATNTHIRDEFDDRTPIDMDRLFQMFAKAGFQGYMSIEYERELGHGEDPMTGVPKLAAEVRKLCEKYSTA